MRQNGRGFNNQDRRNNWGNDQQGYNEAAYQGRNQSYNRSDDNDNSWGDYQDEYNDSYNMGGGQYGYNERNQGGSYNQAGSGYD